MDHRDHVSLLQPAKLPPGGVWADFGAGSGAFTLALRELIGPAATIYAVDKDGSALKELERAYSARFDGTENLVRLSRDFSRALDIPPLDGALMANSLHFFKDRERVLRQVHSYLQHGATLLVVEYNTDSGNLWVPHPCTFETYCKLAVSAGFNGPRLLAKHPSRFLGEFFSAAANA